jgi:hypothetical protein
MSEHSDPTLPPIVPRPERLTQRKILEKLLESRARAAASHSSVRLTRNARGDVQIEVLVATDAEQGIATVEDAAARAAAVYDSLELVYPTPDVENDRRPRSAAAQAAAIAAGAAAARSPARPSKTANRGE